MSSIIVAGDTSGTVTISAPAVAGTPTLTLPTTSGTIVATSGSYVPTTQLASGTASASNYLRGDQTWSDISPFTTIASNVTMGTGTSFTVSGLTLTNYKFLVLSLVNFTAASNFAVTLNAGASRYVTGGASTPAWYMIWIDLTSQASTGMDNSAGRPPAQATGITTASTSFTVNTSVAFSQGTYYLYGVK